VGCLSRRCPLLALLACPLMMLLCMRGMRGHGNQQQTPITSSHAMAAGPSDPTSERITALERELAALHADRNGAGPHPGSRRRDRDPDRITQRGTRPAPTARPEAGRGGRR
jgi:hypothetical protein